MNADESIRERAHVKKKKKKRERNQTTEYDYLRVFV